MTACGCRAWRTKARAGRPLKRWCAMPLKRVRLFLRISDYLVAAPGNREPLHIEHYLWEEKMRLTRNFVVCCGLSAIMGSALADTAVTIGLSGPLTGNQAGSGKDNENGARLAIQDLNAKPMTIGGQKVTLRLDSEDDQGDPKVGVQIAQKLVDSGAIAILGPNNSGVAIPASRVFNGAGVAILPVASNPALTAQGFNNIFRIGASDAQLGGSMAEFAAKTLKAKTAAIIDDRTAYGQGVAEQFASVAKAHGIKIVDNQYTNSSATDFLGILTTIKAKNPDVIFFGGYAAQGAPMAKQMRQRGLRAKLLGGDGICSADMGKVAGEDASIVYCAQGGTSLEKRSEEHTSELQ